jgi:hypothetical protein
MLNLQSPSVISIIKGNSSIVWGIFSLFLKGEWVLYETAWAAGDHWADKGGREAALLQVQVEEVGAAARHSGHTRVPHQLAAAHRQLAQLRQLLSQLAQPSVGDVTLSQIQRSAKRKIQKLAKKKNYFLFANSLFAERSLDPGSSIVPSSTITSTNVDKSQS